MSLITCSRAPLSRGTLEINSALMEIAIFGLQLAGKVRHDLHIVIAMAVFPKVAKVGARFDPQRRRHPVVGHELFNAIEELLLLAFAASRRESRLATLDNT